ncbi:hypothetical protein BN8_p06809 (plasmid) [Fibrisoma limi BUZ 3]|uniref:Uncharacterized protein n=1 Tax=Fibrisoma limi BUZ 3 TaxID=1185876 RepID=I2GU12_9BACT|nr:hypothetical protein [Fibrisoma limi]CCH57613.1 hypothetical protein BN8_p06809 [Fibrisoma limi BUZ 3]
MKTTESVPAAFVGQQGRLYIRVRKVQPEPGDEYTNRTAVYPSVEAYNTRSALPEYVDLNTVIDEYTQPVTIDPQTLTILNEEPS